MEIEQKLNKIYQSKNEVELFDAICILKRFTEENNGQEFFEERFSKNGNSFLTLRNNYSVLHIYKIFNGQHFIKSILNVLKFQRDHKEIRSVPNTILKDGYFINLSLNCCFYFVSYFSKTFKQNNISYIGKCFWDEIKKIEKNFFYEFSKIDILNAFESLIFDKEYFFKKDFSIDINGPSFYNNLKKSRLIIGNYFVDFSIPILLSNSFKKIVSIKKKAGDGFSLKDSANRLKTIIKKYHFFNDGFKFDELDKESLESINSFKYYFERRESKKILLLINLVIEGLDNFSHEEFFKKMEAAENIINKIKKYFYENYNIFPNYTGPKNETGQWSNKSFLNTIKFLTLLDVAKNSNDNKWKIDIFFKYFNDWIYDLHDNINYFSELDDYNKLNKFLKFEESSIVEFKSTFGLPIQDYKNGEEFNAIKKDIVNKIAYTILAMANSSGGNIFIGVVEKIEKISDKIKSHIMERDGIYFLDIQFSLKQEKGDFDTKRLLLQQILKNLTKERLDFLDSLFSFHFYKIYIENKGSCIEILNIEVKKSEKNIFIKKDDVYITLPKRLNGRVELVNPENEFYKIGGQAPEING